MSSFNHFVAAPAALSGGVPAVFTVSGVECFPSSFLPAVTSRVGAVVLSAPEGGLVPVPGRLEVRWVCPDSGLSGVLVALASGFAGGRGGAASAAFHAAVKAAVASGSPVFVGGAPGVSSGRVASGYFCAVSASPFAGEASAAGGASF